MLKLSLLSKFLRVENPQKTIRCYIVFADSDAADVLSGATWLSAAAKNYGVGPRVVTLDGETLAAIRTAQKAQDLRLAAAPNIPSGEIEPAPVTPDDGTRIGLAEAARILQELGICKAFGPTGHVNGPNCQRFGRRDAETGKWFWDVGELIAIAEKRNSASAESLKSVRGRFSPVY